MEVGVGLTVGVGDPLRIGVGELLGELGVGAGDGESLEAL